MITIAFACVHNSCRSQMSEAIAKKMYGNKYNFVSFGSQLKNEINADAISILKKYYQIDISNNQKPKLFNEIKSHINYLVIMGCDIDVSKSVEYDYCENWNLIDPTGKDETFFIEVAKKIEEKLYQLIYKIENKLI